MKLDRWLKGQEPAPVPREGIGGWLGAQKAKLSRFWFDTPETTHARGLRTAGRFADAFAILDRAVRARPDGPELLRELYRLHDAAGLRDLCYRPLRQIEKLAEARVAPDRWVLEELAKLCERLGQSEPAMFDRAMQLLGQAGGGNGSQLREGAGGRDGDAGADATADSRPPPATRHKRINWEGEAPAGAAARPEASVPRGSAGASPSPEDYGRLMPTKLPSFSRESVHRKEPSSGLS